MTDGFPRHRLSLGVLHFDNWHWRGYRIFNFDARRLPGMSSLIRELHERGVRVVTILQGCVKRDAAYDVFADGKRTGVFCKRPDGRTVFAPLWAGWTAYPHFTDPGVRSWWKSHYGRLLEAGFDGFWHDMNERSAFAAWGDFTLPRSTRHALDGYGGYHREAHNLFGLLMNRAGYEGLRELQPERRPWLLCRSGWVGTNARRGTGPEISRAHGGYCARPSVRSSASRCAAYPTAVQTSAASAEPRLPSCTCAGSK